MRGYRITQTAADDLRNIFLEGLNLFGMIEAGKYHHGLATTFEFLAEYPYAARLRNEIRPPVRAYPFKSHLIIYELDDNETVVILRIRHSREDWL